MDVRKVSFRLLQVFVQVVQSGSISQAARVLHLTQPTVSMQLKKLSDNIGETLLVTQNNRQVTTVAGDEVYSAACDVLGRFEELNDTLQQARKGYRGRINLAIVTTAKYLLPRILTGFCQSHPDVDVTLSVGNRAQILEKFYQHASDLYLFSHPPSGRLVRAVPIASNPLHLIAPKNHWAAGKRELKFKELEDERFLLREQGSATRMAFESWLSSEGHELHNTLQIESNEAIRLSVASGLGLSVLSGHTLQEGKDKVAYLKLEGFPLASNWFLVSRRDLRLSAAAQEFERYVCEAI
ncbi:LysR family transcriptional regulator [Gilvimarinus algae]|uniref:LysR family transcriptional regulator n=1 Tax=Gilvimarinus algae TaxID=3058037 RepID=A0ABT8TK59_9GAMM|nr:LysR family transcriptional regulator [Gilvimarinus sp. SDUM040014]MDO3383021.1 LysR family transcriptional regulator [Gilvimarinus sp. SDUM040014]